MRAGIIILFCIFYVGCMVISDNSFYTQSDSLYIDSVLGDWYSVQENSKKTKGCSFSSLDSKSYTVSVFDADGNKKREYQSVVLQLRQMILVDLFDETSQGHMLVRLVFNDDGSMSVQELSVDSLIKKIRDKKRPYPVRYRKVW